MKQVSCYYAINYTIHFIYSTDKYDNNANTHTGSYEMQWANLDYTKVLYITVMLCFCQFSWFMTCPSSCKANL